MIWWLLFITLSLAWTLTGLLRRYALARNLMDVPNQRSSHTVATPRGGGVAIVLAFLLALVFLLGNGQLSASAFYGLAGSGALVAIIGFLDDHGHIAARWRLLGHFSAASIALIFQGGLSPVLLFGTTYDLGIAGDVLAAVFLVWMLNLYNFMDGIDGLASVEAVTTCLSGALLYLLVAQPGEAFLPLMLAAATAGFLIWNFPPAKIFMGDAGSGFLGITLGVLVLSALAVDPALFWGWLILLGVFVVDATTTLLRRLLRGDRVYEAHRSHAYQYASRQLGSHRPVTLAVLFINVVWLLPLACSVSLGYLDGLLGVLVAYAGLFVLALKFKAGVKEN
ncbi:glycosyltransferase family 4 protein [Pseudomonas tructae]|uniref:Glycosyltransferase family 4 protein n=1 Tax=Pseudomonas tructae TaxID=2518644 RepID=A0A411MM58_9PSED|nr:glycosyltransferase family 4 protein [Pseudomonas tructae]QBF27915.1 glycosyltransferase family 4 protein [Pseudomonas tructae]